MSVQEKIFEITRKVLETNLDENIEVYEDSFQDGSAENHLNVENGNFWVSYDSEELTEGYGFNHRHFNFEYDEVARAVTVISNLLTKPIRETTYYRGEEAYKVLTSIKLNEDDYEIFSTTSFLSFPLFWKKKRQEIKYYNPLLEAQVIQKAFHELENVHNIT